MDCHIPYALQRDNMSIYEHLQDHIFFKDGRFYNVEKEEIPIVFATTISARRVYLPAKIRPLIENLRVHKVTIEFMDRREQAVFENGRLTISDPIHYKGIVRILMVHTLP